MEKESALELLCEAGLRLQACFGMLQAQQRLVQAHPRGGRALEWQ